MEEVAQGVWQGTYNVTSYLANPQRRLGLYSLLNILQDASSLHAEEQQFGFEDMLENNIFWVLVRQKVVMEDWPSWRDVVTVKTWNRLSNSPFASRDFEIFLGSKKIGEATTGWVALDAKTRKPARIELAKLFKGSSAQKHCALKTRKIGKMSNFRQMAQYVVRNSDIDINHHVNNTRYAQWILDSIPLEWHHRFVLKSYEVNFLSESNVGDPISIQMSERYGEDKDHFFVQFKGVQTLENKDVFIASLGLCEMHISSQADTYH